MYFRLLFVILFIYPILISAQEAGDSLLYIPWKKRILHNNASFKSYGKLTWGSGFLMKYNEDTIAVTARDLTGTWYNAEEKVEINEFNDEMISWEMYVSDNPTKKAQLNSLIMQERLEKSKFIFLFSVPILSFSLKNSSNNIIPLQPDLNRIRNNDLYYLVGYDDNHNLKIVEGIVETVLNEKYADYEIRLKTLEFMYYDNFIGAAVVNKVGDVIGIVNRAFYLKKNKKGKIIKEDKEAEGSYFEYFVLATPVGLLVDKKYWKK